MSNLKTNVVLTQKHQPCLVFAEFTSVHLPFINSNNKKRKEEEKVGPHHHGNWETSALSYFAVFKSSTMRKSAERKAPKRLANFLPTETPESDLYYAFSAFMQHVKKRCVLTTLFLLSRLHLRSYNGEAIELCMHTLLIRIRAMQAAHCCIAYFDIIITLKQEQALVQLSVFLWCLFFHLWSWDRQQCIVEAHSSPERSHGRGDRTIQSQSSLSLSAYSH